MEEDKNSQRKRSKDSSSSFSDPLALSLSPPTPHPKPSPSPPVPPPPPPSLLQDPFRPRSRRTTPSPSLSSTIDPPYPWSTNLRATIHPLPFLISNNLTSISGTMQCRRCNTQQSISYDLHSQFHQLSTFIRDHKHAMHDRAPPEWMNPHFPTCPSCSQPNSMRPVISPKKRSINWLFMLLGQTLGCCTLDQLKYFCKHTKNHRTGAKDRVLYLTYLALCKQLHPDGPYNLHLPH